MPLRIYGHTKPLFSCPGRKGPLGRVSALPDFDLWPTDRTFAKEMTICTERRKRCRKSDRPLELMPGPQFVQRNAGFLPLALRTPKTAFLGKRPHICFPRIYNMRTACMWTNLHTVRPKNPHGTKYGIFACLIESRPPGRRPGASPCGNSRKMNALQARIIMWKSARSRNPAAEIRALIPYGPRAENP